MTTRQRKNVMRYIADLLTPLRLRDWEVYLKAEPCENPDHAATVGCVPGRKRANVQLAADFFDMDPHEQRHVLVHELLHVHFDGEFQYVEDTLPGLIGSIAYQPFEKAFRDRHEHAVDALASVLAPHFAVPEL